MGNEQSHLSGLKIDGKSVEVSNFWSQHAASISTEDNPSKISVFIGDLFIDGALWVSQTPLEKNSKNLMIYRHPCIVKYISSWQRTSKYYLAVEEVVPLSHILPSLNTLQICIGLYSILKALCFLHDKALVSHNNICISSIYVTADGNWKLAGMEYLCKFNEITSDFLSKSKICRYSKALDSNEEKHLQNSSRKDFIDVFAFGVLVCEVLRTKVNDKIASLTKFRDYAKHELQSVSVNQRPKLSNILQHEFFNHNFIFIHSFLIELPLKSDDEKTEFFFNLIEKLRNFDEIAVANQLGDLLLSRMVLLNKTAQSEVLPKILYYTDSLDSESEEDGLFSEETFKQYLSPKLLKIFRVRDAQIRLLLLNHFQLFMKSFSKDELQLQILPELLVGIKDTNDHLVAVTLKILADLVPILGAASVIGGKRAKLFTDGRPNTHLENPVVKNSKKTELIIPLDVIANEVEVENAIIITSETELLPERPQPDGEEVETSTEEVEQSVEEDLENWEDWDAHEANHSSLLNNSGRNYNENILNITNDEERTNTVNNKAAVEKRTILDVTELDIKNVITNNSIDNDEINFFQDMEPVIQSTAKFFIDKSNSEHELSKKTSLNLNVEIINQEDGWDDEEWDGVV